MSIINGNKITSIMVSAANGDTYGDAERKLFRGFQELVQPNVKSMALATPPGSPVFGDAYVVAASPTGAWTGQAGSIAAWAIDSQDGVVTTGAWEFYAPLAGWRVYDNNTLAVWAFNGTSWQLAGPLKITQAAAATTTLNPATANSFRITVGIVVTSVVISNGIYDGQEVTLLWVQDATGHAVSGFSANIHGATTPSAGANSVSQQKLSWDSTLSIWYAVAAGVTGM
jgi:hypothetical protein